MTPTKISVIIPTYYKDDLLRKAINSVLTQNHGNIELIVVDDSGEKYAKQIVDEYENIIYLPMPENSGQNAALNCGIEQSTGEYIQFLDDDDEILKGKFTKQLEMFNRAQNVGVVYCGGMFDDGECFTPNPQGRGDVLALALKCRLRGCLNSTMLIDKRALNKVLPLPDVPGSTDTYTIIELAQVTEFDFVDGPFVLKRDRKSSVGSSEEAVIAQKQLFKKYKGLYDRYPDHIHHSALALNQSREATLHIENHGWSLTAIHLLLLSVYYEPGISAIRAKYIVQLIGSLFGQPGLNRAEIVFTIYRDMTRDR